MNDALCQPWVVMFPYELAFIKYFFSMQDEEEEENR
jgi:hypothetical protein